MKELKRNPIIIHKNLWIYESKYGFEIYSDTIDFQHLYVGKISIKRIKSFLRRLKSKK